MVKNSPSSAGGEGLIVGQGTKFPHAVRKLSGALQLPRPCALEPRWQLERN